MSNLMKQFTEDAEARQPTDTELMTISKLAVDQRDWEKKVKQLETDLAHATESLKTIREYLLPEAMTTVGLSEFKLLDGSKISIKDDVFASVRKDSQYEAFRWLDEQGLGDVIKNEVSVGFGRGDNTKAHELYEFCKKQGLDASEKESIHSSTLKALVKEQMARGIEFPAEYFSVMPFKKAVIK